MFGILNPFVTIITSAICRLSNNDKVNELRDKVADKVNEVKKSNKDKDQ